MTIIIIIRDKVNNNNNSIIEALRIYTPIPIELAGERARRRAPFWCAAAPVRPPAASLSFAVRGSAPLWALSLCRALCAARSLYCCCALCSVSRTRVRECEEAAASEEARSQANGGAEKRRRRRMMKRPAPAATAAATTQDEGSISQRNNTTGGSHKGEARK